MYVMLTVSGGSRAVQASSKAEGVTKILGDTDWKFTNKKQTSVQRTDCTQGHNTSYSLRVISKKEYDYLKGN